MNVAGPGEGAAAGKRGTGRLGRRPAGSPARLAPLWRLAVALTVLGAFVATGGRFSAVGFGGRGGPSPGAGPAVGRVGVRGVEASGVRGEGQVMTSVPVIELWILQWNG